MIIYFRDKKNKTKRKNKKYQTLTILLKSVDAFVIITTTWSLITLSLTGIELMAIPISITLTCGLSFGNKVIYEKIIYKYNTSKTQYEKDKQTNIIFDKNYRKSIQDNKIDKLSMKVYVNFLLNIWKKQKLNLFYKHDHKTKIKLF